MHAGLQKRFAVQGTPQADRAELLAFGQWFVGKIGDKLIRSEIDIGKDYHAGVWLFENLRAPTRFSACVKTLAAVKTEHFEDADQSREVISRRAIGVMIVIRPAKTDAILSRSLELPRPVTALPVIAFRGEEPLARVIDAKIGNRALDQVPRFGKAFCLREISQASRKKIVEFR